jgi:hypothetical protein
VDRLPDTDIGLPLVIEAAKEEKQSKLDSVQKLDGKKRRVKFAGKLEWGEKPDKQAQLYLVTISSVPGVVRKRRDAM